MNKRRASLLSLCVFLLGLVLVPRLEFIRLPFPVTPTANAAGLITTSTTSETASGSFSSGTSSSQSAATTIVTTARAIVNGVNISGGMASLGGAAEETFIVQVYYGSTVVGQGRFVAEPSAVPPTFSIYVPVSAPSGTAVKISASASGVTAGTIHWGATVSEQ